MSKRKKKERKQPPAGSAFSVTAEPVNVVFARPRSGFLLQAERFSNFNVNMLRWRRSSRSSVHQQQVNKSQTNPGPLVPVTLWFPWHFKTLDMFVHVCVCFSDCMNYWRKKRVCAAFLVHSPRWRTEKGADKSTWRRTPGTDCAHRKDIKWINHAHTHAASCIE